MPSWRNVFQFGENEDVDFATVHHRYRERMMALSGAIGLEDIEVLNHALNEAREEIGPTQRAKR